MAAAASATATAAAAATASPVMAAAVVAVAAAATGPLPDVAPMAAAAGDLLSGGAVGCGCCGGGQSITRRGCRPMGRCNVRALAAAAGGGQAEEQPRGGWRGAPRGGGGGACWDRPRVAVQPRLAGWPWLAAVLRPAPVLCQWVGIQGGVLGALPARSSAGASYTPWRRRHRVLFLRAASQLSGGRLSSRRPPPFPAPRLVRKVGRGAWRSAAFLCGGSGASAAAPASLMAGGASTSAGHPWGERGGARRYPPLST